ncbi:hypothetical protein CwatDRAFT_2043 [Crocosphaera watsonii WH 8501]|uniref:Uncharacterized protein n=1 Tax=Crocosphaera watsonii WH 8501 TaxID=165597 RepID=Q4BZS2_CROWT|nr:hypothetical protein CwatDRAFT_2043 [Crocosphaera watsonii WH 8501]
MDINFEILPLVSLKHIVVASHESFCKNLVDYFRQAALVFNEDGSGFAVTVTEPTATISIPVLNDGVPEGLETVRFTLESGEDYTPDPNADEATFSLVDSSILPLDFNTQANTVQFVGSPLQTINAKFSLIGGDLNRAIEVGIFEVDDDTGGIDYRWGWDY